MNKKEIFLKQLACTTYTSYNKILEMYDLCERNINRLISLQEAVYMNPKQLDEFIKSENTRWTSVVKVAKIEAD